MPLSSLRLASFLLLAQLYVAIPCIASVPISTHSHQQLLSSLVNNATSISLPSTLHSKAGNHYLIFLTRSPATLFINGRPVSQLPRPGKTVLRLPRKLQKGDVLTMVANHVSSGRPGVMLIGAGVDTGIKWRAQFVLRGALKNTKWTKLRRYNNVCKWRAASIVDAASNGGASFIWPRGTSRPAHVARFRYVVGGEDTRVCKGLANEKDMAVISVAATDRAWVFVNGFHIMDIMSKSEAKSKRYRLAKGDVVSVKAMDVVLKTGSGQYEATLPHEFGFVVDVHYKGRHITTRPGNGPWKVIAMYKTPDPSQQFAFMRKAFDDCPWNTPVKPKFPPVKRAMPFPYGQGARYVWADNAQRHSAIVFARLVIDGDANRCGDLGGQGTDDLTKTCACEEVSSAEGSVCYYFMDSRLKTCDHRECDPKYVCTGKDETPDSLICIKKHITHRIVPVEGTDTCTLDAQSHHIYVPYHKD